MRTLAIGVCADGSLPTEFRLFTAGWNDTENGRFLFDADAAASVMAAHEKWGVDLMIDLEHQALNAGTPPEPTARDARGWFRLELRPDGSLWAVSVSWTSDGAQRLADKRQRYVSPAFSVDPETSRVTAIINVALVAIPATHDTPALVAASARGNESMDPKLIAEALDALVAGDAEKSMEILKGLIAAAAGGEVAAEPAAEEPVAEMAVEPAAEEDEDKAEVVAATARLTRITGKTTLGGAVDEVEIWRLAYIKHEEESARLASERAALELGKRKENAVALTKLGAETPHTSGLASGKLCARLLGEDLTEQTARVAALLAARGGKLPAEVKPPVVVVAGLETLSAREVAMCADMKIDPKEYAARKAATTKKAG